MRSCGAAELRRGGSTLLIDNETLVCGECKCLCLGHRRACHQSSSRGKMDEKFMLEAIAESKHATSKGFMPFGAVLVFEGKVLLKAHNCIDVSDTTFSDVTRHAELELIRKACAAGISAEKRKLCTLYTSTEPCVMCAGAIFWSGIETVVYGCSAESLKELSSGGFDIPIKELYSQATKCIESRGGVLEAAALAVHREFWIKSSVKRGGATLDEVSLERSLRKTTIGYGKAIKSDLVPVIDLSGSDEIVAQQIWKAASTVGFFTIVNHGIDMDIIDSTFNVSEAFFNQTVEQKRQQAPYSRALNSG